MNRSAILADLIAGAISPDAPIACPYCAAARPSYRPTCGAEPCRREHRRIALADYARFRYHYFREAGVCRRCGAKTSSRPARRTGRLVTRCDVCRKADRLHMREIRAERKKAAAAEKARQAAIVRLAEIAIERRRADQARLDAGLPLSLRPASMGITPLPKDTPRPTLEV